jgi:hypothetical protein
MTVQAAFRAGNGAYGFFVGNGSTITGCVARDNSTIGIATLQECVIADCAVQDNGTDGVSLLLVECGRL